MRDVERAAGPMGILPQPDIFAAKEDIAHFLRRNRLAGIITVFLNLVLSVFIVYIFVRFDILVQDPSLAVIFGLIILLYTLLSAYVVLMQYKNFTRFSQQNDILHRVLPNYLRRTEELQIAARIARDASVETDLQQLLQRAVEMVRESFVNYHAGIFMVQDTPDGRSVVLRAAAGQESSQQLVDSGHRIEPGSQSIVGAVAETGRARVVLDTRADLQHKFNPLLPDTRSELAVPLRVGEEIIGVLDIQSSTAGAFSQNDVIILQTLADLLAIAVNKTRLNDRVQAYAANLEQMVGERTSQLASERTQLKAILDGMTEGVIYYQQERPVYINQSLGQMLGYQMEDMLDIDVLMTTSERGLEEARKLRQTIGFRLQKHGTWQGEMRLRRKDLVEFDAQVNVTLVRHNDHDGYLLVISDISQQKALQEQQTRFVAYASHELRTPLANLKTRLYLLKRQPQLFEKHFVITQQVVSRMERLVDDLLTKSRFERGLIEMNRHALSLQELIHDVADLQRYEAEKKQIHFALDLPEQTIRALIDRDRMVQVLTNLVSNAINYTPDAGSVYIRLAAPDDGSVDIVVEDTGVGIPPQFMAQVFQPFFRANNVTQGGTGLGLNISKQIIDLHEGEIFVESELNRGTRFTVRLKRLPDSLNAS